MSGLPAFYKLYLLNDYNTRAERFINSLKKEGVNIIGESAESVDYASKEIKLYVFGSDYNNADIQRWEETLNDMGLEDTELTILQSQDNTGLQQDIEQMKELYVNNLSMLSSRDETIREKDMRITELEKDLLRYAANEVRFDRSPPWRLLPSRSTSFNTARRN